MVLCAATQIDDISSVKEITCVGVGSAPLGWKSCAAGPVCARNVHMHMVLPV